MICHPMRVKSLPSREGQNKVRVNIVFDLLKASVDPILKIGDTEEIFGFKSPDCLINITIIVTIQAIYKNRPTRTKYLLNEVKRILSDAGGVNVHILRTLSDNT